MSGKGIGFKYGAVLACVLLAASCVKRPEGVLSDKKMAPVVADLQLAEAYLQSRPQGVETARNKEALIEYVIEKHGLTRAEFDSTMSWYGRNVDEYRNLYDKVNKELAKRKRKLAGASSAEHETEDLWPYTRQSLISHLSDEDGLRFSIPTAGVTPGQRLELKMRLRSGVAGSTTFGVEYDNGAMAYTYKPVSGSRRLKVSLQTDTALTVKRIFGNFSVTDRSDLPLWIDSIYLHALPYDSLEYYQINSQRLYHKPARRKALKAETDSLNEDSTLNTLLDNDPEDSRRMGGGRPSVTAVAPGAAGKAKIAPVRSTK